MKMQLVVSAALAGVSTATGFVFFLPLIVNGDTVFYEHNLVILYGEFGLCVAFMALGIAGVVKAAKEVRK